MSLSELILKVHKERRIRGRKVVESSETTRGREYKLTVTRQVNDCDLRFQADTQLNYCGGEYRVLSRLERRINEIDGQWSDDRVRERLCPA